MHRGPCSFCSGKEGGWEGAGRLVTSGAGMFALQAWDVATAGEGRPSMLARPKSASLHRQASHTCTLELHRLPCTILFGCSCTHVMPCSGGHALGQERPR